MATDPGDLVLDPTCGSGTTAYVAEQWGRRWITCDTSRVALALARTRLMAAKYPYFLLADSPEGRMKEAEISGRFAAEAPTGSDIKKGFVYKCVPHIMLKSIANNSEIDAIYEAAQQKLDALRSEISALLGKDLTEEELRASEYDSLPQEAQDKYVAWIARRNSRKMEIDAAIARRADQETLYDQPYEDGKRVRVAGPFTVESLSPHRVLPADTDGDGTVTDREKAQHQDFAVMILDNLRKAGVQNTVKNERLKFDRLDAFAGAWIHAAGEYTDREGQARRVAVSIGPEHGTVGPEQVKEAAKEALRGVGYSRDRTWRE